jgi:adenylate cyclase
MVKAMETMAVLFADISGSTRLYNSLGDVAASAVISECLAVMVPEVERYQGRIIKTIGDEIMCVFPCADQGLLSASAMHAAVAAASPGGSKVSIHVGLHFGPVVSEDGDVFGDTVNAAAYLTAVAGADQILLTEATEVALSPELKICVRPVFMAVLKGASGESTIFQVLWKKDNPSITDVNLGVHKIIPGDLGSLLVTYGERQYRVDQHTSSVLMGRGEDCDVVVADRFASRNHARVNLQRTHFYLVDQSINGTFVRFDDGEEIHLLRRELLLDRCGHISLGRRFGDEQQDLIGFSRDRRGLYRV